MRAMVMAAGRGQRLRPYTDAVPKPALPVANEPAMGYALRLLAHHGIREVVANAWWKADVLQRVIGDGTAYGVNLTWSVEEEPLGTAGGVKHVEAFLRQADEPFVVLSGDGLHSADLSAMVASHIASGASVTIGLVQVDDPSEYGVTILDTDGYVTAFQEKPTAGTELSNLANTGIYVFSPNVFDLLPSDGTFYDFGSELFPRLVEEGGRQIHGFVLDTYWNDVGGAEAWLDANMAVLDGRVQVPGIHPDESDQLVHPTAQISSEAYLSGPLVVGANARIDSGAALVRGVVLPGAHLRSGQALSAGIIGNVDGLALWAGEVGV